jgi:small nuclear ribonucleoprotein (snRNP)-like protein
VNGSASFPERRATLEPSKKPLNLLVKRLNNDVSIKLKNDTVYRGKMIDCDSHMNVILEGASEYRGEKQMANYGNLILRGSNILYVCVNPPAE